MNRGLDPERVARLQAVLAHWDIPPVTAIEVMGDNQPIFKITTMGPAFTLKDVTNAPNLPRLKFTSDVLAHVAKSGLSVSVPLLSQSAQHAVQSEGRAYLLSAFIEAENYPADPAKKIALFYQVGQALAVLHKALKLYPDDVSSKTWREDLAGHIAGWISALCNDLPAHQAAVVRMVSLARQDAMIVALRGLPEQLIHRDCHPGNMLVNGSRVVGFIDWEDLCIGPPLFDLAYYAAHHLKWEIENDSVTDLWLSNLPRLFDGYRSRTTIPEEEVAVFPHAIMAYHLLLSHWHMGMQRVEKLEIELRSLYWVHTNFDAILRAVRSSY